MTIESLSALTLDFAASEHFTDQGIEFDDFEDEGLYETFYFKNEDDRNRIAEAICKYIDATGLAVSPKYPNHSPEKNNGG